jgi:Putative Flp pilus-assembly TadE/G-like
VLGVLALLILTIAVLATVNLGHAVNERVRLQNTSDAAAYSMAAMEARAFNFYSFANRTQVSHYVTAMLFQSELSMAYFVEAFLVDAFGVMNTVAQCNFSSGALAGYCVAVFNLPFIGDHLGVLTALLGTIRGYIVQAIDWIRTVNLDRFGGRYVIPAYRVMNELLAASSEAVLAATLQHVRQASSDIIVANDPNIDAFSQRLVSGAISGCMLERVHDTAARGARGPFDRLEPRALRDSSKVARAKRVMAGIANATRFSCDGDSVWPAGSGAKCMPGWVTSRIPEHLAVVPDGLPDEGKQLLALLSATKWGQTKLLSYRYSQGVRASNTRTGNFIRDWQDLPGRPVGMLAQGDAMGSDDIYHFGIGEPGNPFHCRPSDDANTCWGDPGLTRFDSGGRDVPFRAMAKTSIWAMSDREVRGGIHWRLVRAIRPGRLYPRAASWPDDAPLGYPDPNDTEALIGLSRVVKQGITVWVANVRPVRDLNHRWEGLTPFPHFEPGQYASSCPQSSNPNPNIAATRRATPNGTDDDFNQPSAFVILNKTAPEMDNHGDPTGAGNALPAMLNMQKNLTFEFGAPTRLVFDDTRMTFLGGKGLNTVARAQTYYHRPGNWHEMPNFFNPYWRPRLAPVWQARSQLPYSDQVRAAMPAPLRNQMQKAMTH